MTTDSADSPTDSRGPMLTRRIAEAVDFAVRAHGAQVRKGTGIPYVSHLLGVAGLVFEGGGDEDQVIAGLLHDVLEDTPATEAQLEAAFGDRVARIVKECSDTLTKPKPPALERKQRYLEHLRASDADVLLVSLADKLHNARTLLLDLRTEGVSVFDRFNLTREGTLWYYRKLVEVFSEHRPGPLTAEFARVVTDIQREALSGSTLDRAVGALLGLACGDAVGTALEFESPGSFKPIRDMVGGGHWKLEAGQWTDDTSMALCLAESIVDTGWLDLEDQLRRYLLWKDSGYLSSNGRCFDIGGATSSQLERFRRTGRAVDPHPDEEKAANGSLMRLAAVPIRWHGDPELAAKHSAQSSKTTHPAQRPVDACRLMGAMISALIGGATFEEVVSPTFWKWGDLHPAISDLIIGAWKKKQPPVIRGTGYCVHALEAALWAVNGADNFEEAVLRAANLGDDADTTAAIAGQLAGARWGASNIPQRWRKLIVAGQRIEGLARRLFVAGGGRVTSHLWPHDDFIHAWWVEPDRLLAGEYPGHREADRARRKLDLLVDAGTRTFVDLTTPGDHLEPYEPLIADIAAKRKLDVRRVAFPIPDGGVVHDDLYENLLQSINEGLHRGGVFVHGWGGFGRTGSVIGCHLAQQGIDYEEIINRLKELRRGSRKADRAAPESPAQHNLILRRVERRRQHT